MSQIMEADTQADDDDWDMDAARAKLRPKVDQSKKARQGRQKKIAQSVSPSARDGRSLRSTGRTKQFNFKALEALKPAAQRAADALGMSLALWMENAVNAALEAQGEARVDA